MAKKRKDSRKKARPTVNGETLRAAVGWAVDEKIFAHLKVHGNTGWQIVDLIMLAMVWVWSADATLTGAFAEARGWSEQVLGKVAVGTYQGLLKALVTWSGTLLPLVWARLHQLMEQYGGKHWRVGRWLPLAVDGSRVSVPRTKDNEKEFCAPNHGNSRNAKHRKKKRNGPRVRSTAKEKTQSVKPQIWLTLLWHIGLQMPWSWKTGPSNSSERDHLRDMLANQKFSANTLFCGDAGFTGYDFWKAITDAGQSFLIRVGANVRLLRKLGHVREREGIVYCWPDSAASKRQPPLMLRLLCLRVGKCNIWLVTNVLNQRDLSNQEAIRLYQLRWGVEIQFRTVKQTFGRRTLRSRSPQRAYVELEWSLLGLWMIQLFAAKEQLKIGHVPDQCSVSLAIRVIRTMLHRSSELPDKTFETQLQTATKDQYKRKTSKRARYRPEYKDKPAAGKPKIRTATREQKTRFQNLKLAA